MVARMRIWFLTAGLLVALALPGPALGGERLLPIEGFLAREATPERMERKILRRGASRGSSYLSLSEFYAFRVPSKKSWNDAIGPAIEGALEADRPLESLRAVVQTFDDSNLLLTGPEMAGVMMEFDLPNKRGSGFVGLVPPHLLGPDRSLTNLRQPGKVLALSGLAAEELPRRGVPDIVRLGLHSLPVEWREGDPRSPKLKEIQDRGAGAWVKFRGRTYEEGEDLERAYEGIQKVLSQSRVPAGKMRVWPGGSDDGEGLGDILRRARYRTSTVELEREMSKQLRFHREGWDWGDRRVKHPTRYGIFTMSVAAERDDGKDFREVVETFCFLVFYTPLYMSFDEAHLYLQVAPEVVAEAVQEGALPFFSTDGEVRFYRGHLDRWLEGGATEFDEDRALRRREVPERVARWSAPMDGKLERSFRKVGENPANWPLRVLPIGSNQDVEKEYSLRVDERDLSSWLHRLVPGFKPSLSPRETPWALSYRGEAEFVNLDEIFDRARVRLPKGIGSVAPMPKPPKVDSATRKKRIAERERRRAEQAKRIAAEERKQESRDGGERVVRRRAERPPANSGRPTRTESRSGDESRRREEESRRAESEREREAEERRAEERRREREEEDERLAALEELEAGLEIEVTGMTLGAPSPGKTYLVTRAGRTLPIKASYKASGDLSGHKLQIIAQGHGLTGEVMSSFVGKSAEIVPKQGGGTISTYIKVPRTLTRSSHMGSYRVDTVLTIDGVPLSAPHTEFIRLGSVSTLSAAYLDPAVVLPSDETELMLNLDLGGWGSEEKIPVAVKLDYKVGKISRSQEFTITRRVGMHHLGVDIDTPDDLPSGDGRYTVTVTAGGVKRTKRGSLLVLDPRMVAERRGYAGRGRLRIDDPSPEVDALLKSLEGEVPRREFVRPDDEEGGESDWDFGDDEDFDFDGEDLGESGVFEDDFDLDSSSEEIAERKRQAEARLQAEREREQAKEEAERRRREDLRRREEARAQEKARKKEEARQAELDAQAEAEERERAAEAARRKERERQKRKEARKKKKRKDLPPDDEEDDFDFDDILDEDESDTDEDDFDLDSVEDEPQATRTSKARKKKKRAKKPRKSPPKDSAEEDDFEFEGGEAAEDSGRGSSTDEDLLAAAESEQLDEEDLPDFVFFIEDEFDVLLEAEAEALGVLYVSGSAVKRTLVWLEEWESAAGEGAPEWLWIIDERDRTGRLRFRRFSEKSGGWKTVLEMPPSFSERSEERAARAMIRKVFRGWVPTSEKYISFGKF